MRRREPRNTCKHHTDNGNKPGRNGTTSPSVILVT
jgi:hypothetical protein